MFEIYNKNVVSEMYKRIPEDIFSGDAIRKTFALYNITPDLLARVFVDENSMGTVIDFFTYYQELETHYYYGIVTLGTSFIQFYFPPAYGVNNIIVQAYPALFFPYGTVHYGAMNSLRGDLLELPYYVRNNDPTTKFENLTITPTDHFEDDALSELVSLFKLSATKEGLNSAVAGQSLNLGLIDDTELHEFWVRVEVPGGFISPYIPYLNIYNISFMIGGREQGL